MSCHYWKKQIWIRLTLIHIGQSQIWVISKLLEIVVSKQLLKSFNSNDLLLDLQSAYRSNHSMKTTVLKVLADILLAVVPQGIVLELILLLLCTADLVQLIKRHQLHPHAFADDTQIYGFCRPSAVDILCERLSTCVDDVLSWMRANRLSHNPAKTDVLWRSSSRRQHRIPIEAVRIKPVLPVRFPCVIWAYTSMPTRRWRVA